MSTHRGPSTSHISISPPALTCTKCWVSKTCQDISYWGTFKHQFFQDHIHPPVQPAQSQEVKPWPKVGDSN